MLSLVHAVLLALLKSFLDIHVLTLDVVSVIDLYDTGWAGHCASHAARNPERNAKLPKSVTGDESGKD